jgi:hypothetical protein
MLPSLQDFIATALIAEVVVGATILATGNRRS